MKSLYERPAEGKGAMKSRKAGYCAADPASSKENILSLNHPAWSALQRGQKNEGGISEGKKSRSCVLEKEEGN